MANNRQEEAIFEGRALGRQGADYLEPEAQDTKARHATDAEAFAVYWRLSKGP